MMDTTNKFECFGGPLDGEVMELGIAFEWNEDNGSSGHYTLNSHTIKFEDGSKGAEYYLQWVYKA